MTEPDRERPERRLPRPRTVLVAALAAVVLLPVAGVVWHAWWPVGATWLMVERVLQGEGYRRTWVPLSRIDPDLVTAVIAAEDARFCRHAGFDFEAIEDALEHNERRPRRPRGASTISQQTAKNVYLWPGRGWVRKGLEAGYTVLIETVWSKRRIMEVYLNVAEFGPGVYGAEAAARHWYGKSARDLTPREAARLAAVLPSPRRWRAELPGPYVRARTGRILANMGQVRAEGLDACVLER